MPQILVVTESPVDDSAIVYRERISTADLESDHFSGQLVERVAWAVGDADLFEREASKAEDEPDPGARASSIDVSGPPTGRDDSSEREERRHGAEGGRRHPGDGGDSRPWLIDMTGEDQRQGYVLQEVGGRGDRA